jgi:hypothetical protein
MPLASHYTLPSPDFQWHRSVLLGFELCVGESISHVLWSYPLLLNDALVTFTHIVDMVVLSHCQVLFSFMTLPCLVYPFYS